jgi:hypothetical protein
LGPATLDYFANHPDMALAVILSALTDSDAIAAVDATDTWAAAAAPGGWPNSALGSDTGDGKRYLPVILFADVKTVQNPFFDRRLVP